MICEKVRERLEDEKRALVSFVTEIDVHMRERTSYTSSLPRLAISTPRSSLGNSGTKHQSLGAVLIETSNTSAGGVLSDLKGEKENTNLAAV